MEPGMTFSRKAYDFVGGFKTDLPMYEGANLGFRLLIVYTPAYKQHIPDIAAIVSPRRAMASGGTIEGILQAYGNYARAYR